MDAATVTLITNLILIAIKYVPELFDQGMVAIGLLSKKEPMTEEEKSVVLAAGQAAHDALQRRCSEQLARAKELGIE